MSPLLIEELLLHDCALLPIPLSVLMSTDEMLSFDLLMVDRHLSDEGKVVLLVPHKLPYVLVRLMDAVEGRLPTLDDSSDLPLGGRVELYDGEE